jgi:hypothetical protein
MSRGTGRVCGSFAPGGGCSTSSFPIAKQIGRDDGGSRQRTPIIRGAELEKTEIHVDSRGRLGVAEPDPQSWPIARVFFLQVDSPDAVRGDHAVSTDERLIVLSGSAVIDLDNGREQATLRLDDAGTTLFIAGGVWRRLRDFAEGTVVLALCAQRYAETETWGGPRPDLVFRD